MDVGNSALVTENLAAAAPVGVVQAGRVGLDLDEFEWEPDLRPSLERGDRPGVGSEHRHVVLVDIDPDVNPLHVAQHDHRLAPGQGGELAGADVDL